MNKNIFLIKLGLFVFFAAIFTNCTSDLDEDNGYTGGLQPVDKTFRITTSKSQYKVGEAVKFEIKGDADAIAVYTGDEGHNYDYKDGQKVDLRYFVNFESRSASSSSGSVHQENQMALLVSKSFNGTFSYDAIKQADWTNFNSSVYWPPVLTTAYTPSGNGYIEEVLDKNTDQTTIYIAIKQTVLNQEINGFGALNRVQNVTLKSTYGAGDELVMSHANMEWTIVSSPNKQSGRAILETATIIQLRNSWWRANSSGNTSGIDYFLENTEDWVVSKAITVPRQKELGASVVDAEIRLIGG